MPFFEELKSYENYLAENPIHELLNIDLDAYGEVDKKIIRPVGYSVYPKLEEAFSAELDDLVRLHYLVTSRKVTTVLEFGVGKSSIIFDHALNLNKKKYASFVESNLRRSNPFQCFSVDNNEEWISVCRKTAATSLVKYHHSQCSISTFNGRVCSFFDDLPNICPDLIYLDGPDQFSPTGDVRGITTKHPDRLPMSGDILTIEHFLLPGTLIVVDGRTANARFLKTNLQRDWSYFHHEDFDQHYFELVEKPLGIYNKRQLEFCLGDQFYERIR
jgi:hypothetical protein